MDLLATASFDGTVKVWDVTKMAAVSHSIHQISTIMRFFFFGNLYWIVIQTITKENVCSHERSNAFMISDKHPKNLSFCLITQYTGFMELWYLSIWWENCWENYRICFFFHGFCFHKASEHIETDINSIQKVFGIAMFLVYSGFAVDRFYCIYLRPSQFMSLNNCCFRWKLPPVMKV